jgi:Short chain fatty acid transporter
MPDLQTAAIGGERFNPINSISRGLTRFVSRYLPDPLIFAIFLIGLYF